jgi:hypothetical protein
MSEIEKKASGRAQKRAAIRAMIMRAVSLIRG